MNAPIRGLSLVRELCIAVAHRWQPERLFVFVYTGYLDESGTHDDSAVTIMGGLLARAQNWRPYEIDFDEIRERHGFRVFHTKKFKNRTGDFKGWTEPQQRALLKDLGRLGNRGLAHTVFSTLNNADYERFYRGANKPSKVRFDSRYGFCFRLCLYYFIGETMKRRLRKNWPHLHIVMEAGHRNFGDAERIFLEVKRDLGSKGCNMLQMLTKADKDTCCQLMMADFVAHSGYILDKHNRQIGFDLAPIAKLFPSKSAPIMHLKPTPEELANIREFVISKALAKRGQRAHRPVERVSGKRLS
jgi:hypothetical protein